MITCPTCQSPNDAGNVSCKVCGAPLASGGHLDALPVGTVVAGKYQIEKVLGRGGFGITYRATHTTLHNVVAVKEYFPENARRTNGIVTHSRPDDKARDEFLREGQALSRLSHPGIVRVTDLFEESNTVYLVMDYVEGKSLKSVVDERGPLGEEEALGYIRQVAEALKVVHSANLLHQDIKPDNLMLRPDGSVVLIDFGSARNYETDKTGAYTRTLTPGYAPIEQYGSAVRRGPYTDFYALSATLYTLLGHGLPPTSTDRMMNPQLPGLDRMGTLARRAIMQGMAVRPQDRPQSAEEFLALLEIAPPAPQPSPLPAPTPVPDPVPSPAPRKAPPRPLKSRWNGWKGLPIVLVGLLLGFIWISRDMSSGRNTATLQGDSSPVMSVVFSPDGKTLASGSNDNSIKFWDVASGRNTATLQGHPDDVLSVAFSPDGKTLASGSIDNTIKLWDVASGRNTATLQGHTNIVNSIDFSPDGKTLASGSYDNSIKFWDVASGRNTATLQGHTNSVFSVAFSPDGKTLASGSWDRTIKLWDVASGRNTATLQGHSSYVRSVAFSPDGKTLASGSVGEDTTIKLWDVASGRNTATLQGHSSPVMSVVFSPDRKTLASGSVDNTIKLWDVASGRNTATLQGHTNIVYSVAFSPDGKTLASGSNDNSIKFWDVASGRNTATLQGHTNSVFSVAFSPDGKTLASGSEDHTIKRWRTR